MPKRKLHKLINTIEHKHCGSCKKWKPLNQFSKKGNGKRSSCKCCVKKYDKQRREVMKEQLEKAREAAPTGFLVCLNVKCTVKGLQPLDQFIHPHVRNDEPTMNCLTCRDKQKEADERRQAACQKVWDDWRREHSCVICNQDSEHVHNPLLIEADHLGGKVTHCSNVSYWSHSDRGPRLQEAELMKCQASCKFHHALITQQRDHENKRILKQKSKLRKRAVINAEKHKRGCCLRCKRAVKEGEERAFEFDHRDPKTKFKYNGKPKSPSDFVNLPDAIFDKQWPLEQAKCDLLCANCHKLKDNRDGYKN